MKTKRTQGVQQLLAQKGELDRTQSELDKTREELETVTDRLDRKQTKVESRRSEVRRRTDELETTVQEVETTVKELGRVQEEVDRKKVELASLRQEVDSYAKEAESYLVNMTQQKTELQVSYYIRRRMKCNVTKKKKRDWTRRLLCAGAAGETQEETGREKESEGAVYASGGQTEARRAVRTQPLRKQTCKQVTKKTATSQLKLTMCMCVRCLSAVEAELTKQREEYIRRQHTDKDAAATQELANVLSF